MALLLAAIYSSNFFRSRMYFPGILDVLISKVRPDYGPTYSGVILKRQYLSLFVLASVFWCLPAQAASRAIVRVQGGASALNLICGQLNCDSAQSIGDPSGQLFVVSSSLDSVGLLGRLSLFPAILSSEPDQVATTTTAHTAPDALYDTTPATYYGQSVPHGYISQPATSIVRLADAQAAFGLTGLGTVAVIDTGVDPNHPVLANVLLPGYDFTRNQPGASEMNDVPPRPHPNLDRQAK